MMEPSNSSQRNMTLIRDAISDLWSLAGLEQESLSRLNLTGSLPTYRSLFRLGDVATATVAASALAATEIERISGGREQDVSVDTLHAALEFQSAKHLTVNGAQLGSLWDPIAGLYRTSDGWVRLHTNFPHHRDKILALLECENNRDAVQERLLLSLIHI